MVGDGGGKKPLYAWHWAIIALLVCAAALLNAAATLLGARVNLSFDLTANEIYKVGEGTRGALAGLAQDVEVSVLSTREGYESTSYLTQVLHILEQYPLYSARVKLAFVDTAQDPSFAARFPALALEANGIVVSAAGGGARFIKLEELFNSTPSADGGAMVIGSSRAEEAVTSAILAVTGAQAARAVFLTGSAEAGGEAFAALLRDNNYEVEYWGGLVTGQPPEGADVAVLLAPQNDLDAAALAALDAFLYNGGAYGRALLCAFDAGQPQTPNLCAFLREWGVDVGDGAVFETDSARTYQLQPFFPVADYEPSAARNAMRDAGSLCVFPRARPLTALFAERDGVRVAALATFAASAAVRPADAGEGFSSQDAARWGPMPALLLASKGAAAESHVLVCSSMAMLESFALESPSLGNAEFLVNALAGLLGRSDVVAIEPKSLARARLAVPSGTATALAVVLALVVPGCLLALGVGVWLRRRYL